MTGVTLLAWAWTILDNVWTYDDSATLSYILLSIVVAIPGAALTAFAIFADRLRR